MVMAARRRDAMVRSNKCELKGRKPRPADVVRIVPLRLGHVGVGRGGCIQSEDALRNRLLVAHQQPGNGQQCRKVKALRKSAPTIAHLVPHSAPSNTWWHGTQSRFRSSYDVLRQSRA